MELQEYENYVGDKLDTNRGLTISAREAVWRFLYPDAAFNGYFGIQATKMGTSIMGGSWFLTELGTSTVNRS